MYDSIDDRIVDGRGFCYDCRDTLGVWGQDVGMPEWDKAELFCFYTTNSNIMEGLCGDRD